MGLAMRSVLGRPNTNDTKRHGRGITLMQNRSRLAASTAAMSLLAVVGAPSSAIADDVTDYEKKYILTVKDSRDDVPAVGDIKKVEYFGAQRGISGASIFVHMRGAQEHSYDHEVSVYLNTDRDAKPEFAIVLVGYTGTLYKTKTWFKPTKTLDASALTASVIDIDTNYLSLDLESIAPGAKKMSVSVHSSYRGMTDWAPGERTWSRKVEAYRPFAGD